mmetsp:Transcript_20234/g.64590  ORF Transcript_20234/g.64590 Transcript_20234/m.64590 type:complete len:830 (+) Transcript_20234:230-2719(+)
MDLELPAPGARVGRVTVHLGLVVAAATAVATPVAEVLTAVQVLGVSLGGATQQLRQLRVGHKVGHHPLVEVVVRILVALRLRLCLVLLQQAAAELGLASAQPGAETGGGERLGLLGGAQIDESLLLLLALLLRLLLSRRLLLLVLIILEPARGGPHVLVVRGDHVAQRVGLNGLEVVADVAHGDAHDDAGQVALRLAVQAVELGAADDVLGILGRVADAILVRVGVQVGLLELGAHVGELRPAASVLRHVAVHLEGRLLGRALRRVDPVQAILRVREQQLDGLARDGGHLGRLAVGTVLARGARVRRLALAAARLVVLLAAVLALQVRAAAVAGTGGGVERAAALAHVLLRLRAPLAAVALPVGHVLGCGSQLEQQRRLLVAAGEHGGVRLLRRLVRVVLHVLQVRRRRQRLALGARRALLLAAELVRVLVVHVALALARVLVHHAPMLALDGRAHVVAGARVPVEALAAAVDALQRQLLLRGALLALVSRPVALARARAVVLAEHAPMLALQLRAGTAVVRRVVRRHALARALLLVEDAVVVAHLRHALVARLARPVARALALARVLVQHASVGALLVRRAHAAAVVGVLDHAVRALARDALLAQVTRPRLLALARARVHVEHARVHALHHLARPLLPVARQPLEPRLAHALRARAVLLPVRTPERAVDARPPVAMEALPASVALALVVHRHAVLAPLLAHEPPVRVVVPEELEPARRAHVVTLAHAVPLVVQRAVPAARVLHRRRRAHRAVLHALHALVHDLLRVLGRLLHRQLGGLRRSLHLRLGQGALRLVAQQLQLTRRIAGPKQRQKRCKCQDSHHGRHDLRH